MADQKFSNVVIPSGMTTGVEFGTASPSVADVLIPTTRSQPTPTTTRPTPSTTRPSTNPATPVATPVATAENPAEAKWLQGLLTYLYNDLLPKAEPDAAKRGLLISAPSINIWKPAFTHQSFNPNIGENYQSLEKLGDPFMKGPFNWFLIQKYPLITEGQIGRFDDFYLSKPFQGQLSESYGLVPWVRSRIDVTLHIKEDVLEAFVGGLFMAGQLLIGSNAGYALVQNFIDYIFSNIQLDMNLLLGNPKNQVKEIFEKMDWVEDKRHTHNEIEYSEELTTGETQITLHFTPLALKQLREWNINITDNIFGVGRGTKVIARDMAYRSAVDYLAKLGITWDWANSMQNVIRVNQLQMAPYYPAVKVRLNKDGLIDVTFSDPYKMANKQYVQLIGKRPDGSKEILLTMEGGRAQGTQEILQTEALKYYAQYGKQDDTLSVNI